MNRKTLTVAAVMALLLVFAFQHGAPAQGVQSLTVVVGDSQGGLKVQYQFRPPGLFDRGTCEFSCRSAYGDPGAWTGDRYQSGSNLDYLRCTNQCDIRQWNDLDRLRKQY